MIQLHAAGIENRFTWYLPPLRGKSCLLLCFVHWIFTRNLDLYTVDRIQLSPCKRLACYSLRCLSYHFRCPCYNHKLPNFFQSKFKHTLTRLTKPRNLLYRLTCLQWSSNGLVKACFTLGRWYTPDGWLDEWQAVTQMCNTHKYNSVIHINVINDCCL